jgi:3',5'-cyclic AMP phosphodiesterase CpdA
MTSAHTPPATRRIWLLSDAHIGQAQAGRDGADWLRLAVDDMRAAPPDYIFNLGDMSCSSAEAQLRTYAEIRQASGMGPWWELVGNHDHASLARGFYDTYVGCPRYWAVRDGNLLFLSLPAEQGCAAGLFLPGVEAWLRRSIAEAGAVNVIVCAHTFPRGTVIYSERFHRQLHPPRAVEAFLRENEVPLWLGGHIHFAPRTTADAARRGRTQFVNVASVSYVYNTGMSNSFVLEVEAGQTHYCLRCRDHERRDEVAAFRIEGNFPHPVALDRPRFTAHTIPALS